jgi:CHAD domain-containing protein
LRRELRWLGRTLGEVRDLDVLLERLATEAGQDAALAPAATAVADVLAKRRATARVRMLRALDSRRYVRLLESLAAFVDTTPTTRRRGIAGQPAALVAPDLLAAAFKKVRRLGERLTLDSKAEDFHRMRIRVKRLRYAIEFHAPLYGAPADDLVERLVALQDHLGAHQDCVVMRGQIDEIRLARAKRLPPGALFAMGTLAERVARRSATLRRQFPRLFRAARGKPWKRLKHAFDARVAEALRPRRRVRPRPAESKPAPDRQADSTGDTSWKSTAPSPSTPPPPTSTAS